MEVESRYTAAILSRDPVLGWRTSPLAVKSGISLFNPSETMTRIIGCTASVIFAVRLSVSRCTLYVSAYSVPSRSPIYYLTEYKKGLWSSYPTLQPSSPVLKTDLVDISVGSLTIIFDCFLILSIIRFKTRKDHGSILTVSFCFIDQQEFLEALTILRSWT